jgi:hypothetical protein
VTDASNNQLPLHELSDLLTPRVDGEVHLHLRTATVVTVGTPPWTISLDGVDVPADVLMGVSATVGTYVAVLVRAAAQPLVIGTITTLGRQTYELIALSTARYTTTSGNLPVAPAISVPLVAVGPIDLVTGDLVRIDLTADPEALGATAGDFFVARVAVNSVVDAAGPQVAVLQFPAGTARPGTIGQHYTYTVPSDGAYTFDVRAQRSGIAGTIRIDDHTTISVAVYGTK